MTTMTNDMAHSMLAIILWKLKKEGTLPNGITVTTEEISDFAKATEEGKQDQVVLFHHWHTKSIDLKILTKADGDRLAQIHREAGGGTSYRGPSERLKEGD